MKHARTIRFRLTVLYGLVFLITGAILLTIGYALVRHNLERAAEHPGGAPEARDQPAGRELRCSAAGCSEPADRRTSA